MSPDKTPEGDAPAMLANPMRPRLGTRHNDETWEEIWVIYISIVDAFRPPADHKDWKVFSSNLTAGTYFREYILQFVKDSAHEQFLLKRLDWLSDPRTEETWQDIDVQAVIMGTIAHLATQLLIAKHVVTRLSLEDRFDEEMAAHRQKLKHKISRCGDLPLRNLAKAKAAANRECQRSEAETKLRRDWYVTELSLKFLEALAVLRETVGYWPNELKDVDETNYERYRSGMELFWQKWRMMRNALFDA